MRIRIHGLNLPLDASEDELLSRAAHKLAVLPGKLSRLEIVRRSVDARRLRGQAPFFTYVIDCDFAGSVMPRARRAGEVRLVEPPYNPPIPRWPKTKALRPVVVGAGPAGLVAASMLAEAGARPIVVERGEAAEKRASVVRRFWDEGVFHEESNVLYGEGGAGLFSDGKLTARSKDRDRVRRFFELLVACGAPKEILWDSEAHLGSDLLLRLVPALRKRIEKFGGEFRWGCRFDDLRIEKGSLRALSLAGAWQDVETCVLATGHSARDVYHRLHERGLRLEPKAMAVGLRLELPQSTIDRARYGSFARDPRLPVASFRLTRKATRGLRPCYSFCMCPGGQVIACASSPGELTTNGMSLARRNEAMGNAAFLVNVGPEDYLRHGGKDDPLAGIAFQREMEARAFRLGGGDYGLPASRLVDFLQRKVTKELPPLRSCKRARPADLAEALPEFVVETLRGSLAPMLRELNRDSIEEALLYAAETRSSSPVRVFRDDDGQAPDCKGLYPAGEGAGHAGGIVSSALDGMRAAEAILRSA